MPKSALVGLSEEQVKEESILDNIFALAPQAEKVYADIEKLLADPNTTALETDGITLFNEVKTLLGSAFKIS